MAVATSCSDGAPELVGTWTPVEIQGKDLTGRLTQLHDAPTLTFENDTWEATNGCNQVSGEYQARSDGSFAADATVQTDVGCSLRKSERIPIPKVLESAASFDVVDGTLRLIGSDSKSLATFELSSVF